MNALLFPGQGAQYAGMLAKANIVAGGAAFLSRASAIVGKDVLAFDDDAALERTDVVQRNTFLASVITAEALRAEGATIAAVAGHSVGAFAAATFAGALAFEDALRLVDLRGRMMDELFRAGYAMGAIVGLDERTVRRLVDACDSLFIAAINASDQITIAGIRTSVIETLAAAGKSGARTAKLLAVSVPSHSSFMKPVRDALARAVERIAFKPATMIYAANVDGRAKFQSADIATDLIESVALPVRWNDATQMLRERGVRAFLEAAPGDTLTMLMNANAEALALAIDRAGIDEAASWLRARSR